MKGKNVLSVVFTLWEHFYKLSEQDQQNNTVILFYAQEKLYFRDSGHGSQLLLHPGGPGHPARAWFPGEGQEGCGFGQTKFLQLQFEEYTPAQVSNYLVSKPELGWVISPIFHQIFGSCGEQRKEWDPSSWKNILC